MNVHTLLFVDDEENILNSLKRLFRREGYNILTAKNATEALKLLEDNPVSLILSDQRMPGMSGVEFLKQVKEKYPDIIRMILTGYADINAAVEAINQGEVYRFITKPWNEEDLKATIHSALKHYELIVENRRLQQMIMRQNQELKKLNEELEQKVQERTRELAQLNRQLERNFMDSIKVFAGLLEMRDSFVGSHSKRVATAAEFIAEKFNLPAEEKRNIKIAAILHDIGKIGIPDEVLKKPKLKLTRQELALIEQHPILGQASIQIIQGLQEVGRIIRHHHETYNGDGYPDKLKGEEIPLGSRIIAVPNEYDVLVYRRDLSFQFKESEVIQFLERNKGVLFDPLVVECFLEFLKVEKTQAENLQEIKVDISQLREDMTLARDLYTRRGVLLIPKGEVLKESYIEKIRNYHKIDPIVDGVYVYLPKS